MDVLTIRSRVLEQNPGRVNKLLKGWFAALRYLREQPQDASQRMAGRLKLEPQEVLAAYAGLRLPNRNDNLLMMKGSPCQLVLTAQRLVKVMIKSKLLQRNPQLDNLVSLEPLTNLKLAD